ncbi:hypothetical protein E4U54_006729, partial [Claviceps lovelessii]
IQYTILFSPGHPTTFWVVLFPGNGNHHDGTVAGWPSRAPVFVKTEENKENKRKGIT